MDSREGREGGDGSLDEDIVSEEKGTAVGEESGGDGTGVLLDQLPDPLVGLAGHLHGPDELAVGDVGLYIPLARYAWGHLVEISGWFSK